MNSSNDHKKGFDIDFIDLPGSTPGSPPPRETPEKPSTDETDGNISQDSSEKIDAIVETIVAKMKRKGNFPSFSRQISSVNKILHLNYASARDIADVITKDFSLSQKLLKLVNSSFYGQFGNKGVSSIREAMIILGADCIQQAAASLMLFEMMQAGSQTDELKDMALGSFMSGLIAKDMAKRKGYRDTENFLICAMFHNLGEFLTLFYFPKKFDAVCRLVNQKKMDKQKAARQITGVTYFELGVGVAGKWGLPGDIISSMRPVAENHLKDHQPIDMLRYFSSFSNSVCEIAHNRGVFKNSRDITHLLEKFEGVIDLEYEELGDILTGVAEKIHEHASQLNINTEKSRLLQHITDAPPPGQSPVEDAGSQDIEIQENKPTKIQEKTIIEEMKHINDVIKKGGYKIGDVMSMVLDIMEKEFNYTRVAMCIKSMDANCIIVRFALGKEPGRFKKVFKFDIDHAADDIFNAALNEGSDVIINDISNKKYGKLIPAWYANLNLSTGFSIYPIIVNRVPFGLFYADTDTLDLKQFMRQHDYMKKLRTLTVKAIKKISS